jgi:hypothetical protein
LQGKTVKVLHNQAIELNKRRQTLTGGRKLLQIKVVELGGFFVW